MNTRAASLLLVLSGCAEPPPPAVDEAPEAPEEDAAVSNLERRVALAVLREDFEVLTEPTPRFGSECEFAYSCTRRSVRGDRVMAFELRKEDFDPEDRGTKSAELKTPLLSENPLFVDTREFWAGFRFRMAPNGLAREDLTLFAQQHGKRDAHLGERGRHPMSALYVEEGLLRYSYRADFRKLSLPAGRPDDLHDPACTTEAWTMTHCGDVQLMPLRQNHWYHVALHEIYDFNDAGLVEVRVEERRLDGSVASTASFARTGISIGYNDERGPFWKFGLYQPYGMSQQVSTIYFDDVTTGVGPGRFEDYLP